VGAEIARLKHKRKALSGGEVQEGRIKPEMGVK
jgi:hypothetical protein